MADIIIIGILITVIIAVIIKIRRKGGCECGSKTCPHSKSHDK